MAWSESRISSSTGRALSNFATTAAASDGRYPSTVRALTAACAFDAAEGGPAGAKLASFWMLFTWSRSSSAMRWARRRPTPLARVRVLLSPVAAAAATCSGVNTDRMASATFGPTPLTPVSI